MRSGLRAALVVVVVLSTLGPAIGLAVAQDGQPGTQANATDTQGYTLEELRRGGDLPAGEDTPQSIRRFSEYGELKVEYPAVGFLGLFGINWDLGPRSSVHSNELVFRAIRFDPQQTDYTVTAVFYDTAERVVTTANATRTVTVPTDVEERSWEISLNDDAYRDQTSITIPKHEGKQAVMWIEGVDGARWAWAHDSAPLSSAVSIDTEAGFFGRALLVFVLPIFVGLLLDAHFVPKILDKVGKGPGNLLLWFGTLFFAIVGLLLLSWVWASNFLISMPLVVAVLVCGAAGAVWLEKSNANVTRLALLGVSTKIDKTFTGGEARSALRGEMPILKVSTLADGRTVVIRRGIVPFLARLWGGAAVLQNAERIKSELELGGNSAADKIVFIDEDADVTYEYEPEGFAFDLDTRTEDGRLDITGILNHLGELAIGGAIGFFLGGAVAAVLGGVGLVVLIHTRATNGVARFTPAEGHFGDALVTAMQLEKGIDENRQREELLRELRTEMRRSEAVVEEVRNASDESVIGSAHDRGVAWPDDELSGERSGKENAPGDD